LYRLFPGVSLEEVRQTTGFAVTLAPDVKTVDAPTEEELGILRTHVDRTGVLRR
jgi:glutaconate CoA-transferase subunit B